MIRQELANGTCKIKQAGNPRYLRYYRCKNYYCLLTILYQFKIQKTAETRFGTIGTLV